MITLRIPTGNYRNSNNTGISNIKLQVRREKHHVSRSKDMKVQAAKIEVMIITNNSKSNKYNSNKSHGIRGDSTAVRPEAVEVVAARVAVVPRLGQGHRSRGQTLTRAATPSLQAGVEGPHHTRQVSISARSRRPAISLKSSCRNSRESSLTSCFWDSDQNSKSTSRSGSDSQAGRLASVPRT